MWDNQKGLAMTDNNLNYGFEHWMDLHGLGEKNEANMIEVPGGTVDIGERFFHVGTFKISKLPVTEHTWGKVMGDEKRLSRKSVTDVSFAEISDFLQRLSVPRKSPGRLTIPTEAQLLLAQQGGYIRTFRKHKEICLTQFREPDDMGEHHFFGNLPKEEPFDLVVRQGDNREPLPYKQPSKDTGFRLVLVDYQMTRRQVSDAIVSALALSEYSSVYKRDGAGCLIYFEYSSDAAKVCPPDPHNACMMICPDQVNNDTIVVSTDIVRLPQEMDPDAIMERLIKLNADSKETGIRYEAPWLYHASAGMNRVLYVVKELRALSELYVIAALPDVINDVLAATSGFKKLFDGVK